VSGDWDSGGLLSAGSRSQNDLAFRSDAAHVVCDLDDGGFDACAFDALFDFPDV
jgi:hypothetical protein